MRLDELKIGEKARIDTVGGKGATRQHFLDMGVIPGAKLEIIKFAPMGDPVEIQIHTFAGCTALERIYFPKKII